MKSSKGFTLIEVLVALCIFSIVCVATAPAFINHASANTNSERKTTAINFAQNILDDLRKKDVTNLLSSGSEEITNTIDSKNLIAKVSYCTKSTYCSTASRHILVEVFFNDKNIYSVETVYTQLK